MQFKNPEILYFLLLLIIPILVHLFQLRKFKKVPFTNVAFLQKLVIENRKSSQLKKWLILATRMLLIAATVIAFAQPYFSNATIDSKQHFTIYLDNSLSNTAKGEKGNLLQIAAQEIAENASEKNSYHLITNDEVYKNLSNTDLKNTALKIKSSAKPSKIKDILLQIETINTPLKNTSVENIIISDFQNTQFDVFSKLTSKTTLIQLLPELKNNISIDSLFITDKNANNFNLTVRITNNSDTQKDLPTAIYNNKKLVTKKTVNIDKKSTNNISFTVENTPEFLGEISTSVNDTYSFDNNLYFTVQNNETINVMAIGNNNSFLSKIYTNNEFKFLNSTVEKINYNAIDEQQLIILNELESISESLQKAINQFVNKGGNVVIIPNNSLNLSSYNSFFNKLSIGKIDKIRNDSLKITQIVYDHPLFKNVFDKRVKNFQYPTTKNQIITALNNASKVIKFEDNSAFIQQINNKNGKIYWFASALNKNNSNFTNSPLVVPVFYNIGLQSLQFTKSYYTLHQENTIEISTQLQKEEIVAIENEKSSFIPLQQSLQNKIKITTTDQPATNGFYKIVARDNIISQVAFNNPISESSLNFLDFSKISEIPQNINIKNNVAETLQEINKKNEVQWLWKWFLILAIVSLLLEILILKYFKV
ncbi:BatA domain-containing protein [Tenacibaculum geojense]|uniref:BatA domain-containing protein n=1 Tax=Tenacibaculum geojense TaxID=915352 RepID=A0ABW3JNN8_9FLAO